MRSVSEEPSSDEEEILVYVEFDGAVGGNAFSDEHLQLDMIGIDTEHPIMQINGRFYEGTYEDAVGTYMFFSNLEEPTIEDTVFDTPTTLRYVDKTKKILRMQRVFAKPRTEVLGDSEHTQCIPNREALAQAGVPLKYQDQALNFWKTMRDDRMGALQSYLEKQKIREEKRRRGIQLDSESDEDNPFAAYKQKEEAHKPGSTSFEENEENEENDSSRRSSKETTANDTEVASKTGRSKKKEKLDTAGLKESTVSPAADGEKSTKRKSTVVRKKKVGVVHDARKKVSKKKRLVSKFGNTLVPDDEGPSTSAASTQIEEPDITEIIDVSGLTEVSESDTTSDVQRRESIGDRNRKQLKREAKIREISERLKTIAESFTNVTAD